EAGKLTHGIKFAAISGRVNAARKRKLSGIAEVLFVVPVFGQVGLGVESANGNSGNCGEASIFVLIEIGAGRCANRRLWILFRRSLRASRRCSWLTWKRAKCEA